MARSLKMKDVPCISAILTTLKLYSGKARMGLLVNNKYKRSGTTDKSYGGVSPPPSPSWPDMIDEMEWPSDG